MASSFGKFVGGRLSLDFVNTVKSRVLEPAKRRAERVEGERLTAYDDLLRWATLTSTVTERDARALARHAAAHPAAAAAVLKRGLAVREAMYRLFTSAMDAASPDPDDLALFNREVQIARSHEQLVAAPGFGWAWEPAPQALDRLLWPVVRSAADLLTSPELARVGQCPGADCGWLFLDTSRGGGRQWCSMADCGNLAKVRRFRRRQGKDSSNRRRLTRP